MSSEQSVDEVEESSVPEPQEEPKTSQRPEERSSLLEKNSSHLDDGAALGAGKKPRLCCRPACSWTVAAIVGVIAILATVQAIMSSPFVRLGTCPDDDRPNVVLFIGDGFGPQLTSLVRLYFNPDVKGDEPFTALNKEESQCQLTFTQTRSASAFVTDSAAAGTALATGKKTVNHYLGVTPDLVPVGNILEAAKLEGYKTGVVVTCGLTHATPAAFTAHVEDREFYELIALQHATLQKGMIDLMIGGGRMYYENTTRSDKRDLVGEMRNNGFTVAYTKEELMKAKKLPLLSLLTPDHMPYKIDAQNSEEARNLPTLKESVEKAIKLLRASDKPFFLMVEGSEIDFAEHANDLAAAVYETKDFLDALDSTIRDANNHGDTIVMSTSDHDTGGLSINSVVDLELLHKITASSDFMYSIMEAGGVTNEIVRETVKNYTTINNITDDEIDAIRNAELPANVLSEIISDRLGVKWGDHYHTDTNVLLYSCFGGWERSEACKYREKIISWLPVFNDNTDIPKFISKRTHSSLKDASERAVKVFTGHTRPDNTTRQVFNVDPIDTKYHSKGNM